MDRPGYFLKRGPGYEITADLRLLDSLARSSLSDLIDDTSAEDILWRLENSVWVVQGYTLLNLIGRTTPEDKAALHTMLEQISWKTGRELAEKYSKQIPIMWHEDLRALLPILQDKYLAENGCMNPLLVSRATGCELQLELLTCPHRSKYEEIRLIADELCNLHAHRLRGCAYFFDSRILMEVVRGERYCVQRFRLQQA